MSVLDILYQVIYWSFITIVILAMCFAAITPSHKTDPCGVSTAFMFVTLLIILIAIGFVFWPAWVLAGLLALGMGNL